MGNRQGHKHDTSRKHLGLHPDLFDRSPYRAHTAGAYQRHQTARRFGQQFGYLGLF